MAADEPRFLADGWYFVCSVLCNCLWGIVLAGASLKMAQEEFETLFEKAYCTRCDAKLKIQPIAKSKATMLRRAQGSKGYCLACAVQDWLRNTYPVNLLLARSGPKALTHPDIQKQFFEIAVAQHTDATFAEIDWQRVIANWDLPFPTKVRVRPENPMDEEAIADCVNRERILENDGLTEEERQVKRAAQRDQVIRKLINLVNPKKNNRPIRIDDSDPTEIKVYME